MSKKILCPTDGSAHAMEGVKQAAQIARAHQAQLTVCIVNVAHGGARGPTINHLDADAVASLLGEAEAACRQEGLQEVGTVELVSREIAPAIVAYAHQNAYDQIVMGTGDKRGMTRFVLGSVAAEVAGQAHCSVTVAR